jgi:hypothetical protein
MGQQAAAGQAAPAGGRGGKGGRYFRGRGDPPSKGFKWSISKIANDTFNTGKNHFAAQLTQSRKNVANYLQPTLAEEGYLVAETVRMGKVQTITLPPPVDASTADVEDQKNIQEEAIRAIAKCKAKLDGMLKKGYATIWDQCSQEVRNKLEASNNWHQIQWEQSLHNLIVKIERICIGFDNYKQEMFNLVQALKTLFLHMQGGRESMEEYSRNFKSLWDAVEAFRGSPGMQKGLISRLLRLPSSVRDPDNVTAKVFKAAEDEVTMAVKAVLLISGASKVLAAEGTAGHKLPPGYQPVLQHLNKAMIILGHYQGAKPSQP